MLNHDINKKIDLKKGRNKIIKDLDDKYYSKALLIDKQLILQDIYKTPKPKKVQDDSKDEEINIFDNNNNECFEIRYLILKKLLEASSKEIMEKQKKDESAKKESFNFETGLIKNIKKNIKRASSPAPSDSSTLSTLSLLSFQRKINEKSGSLLHNSKKTLLTKKKSKSNKIAEQNKTNLWHLTKKAVADKLHIDPKDKKNFNTVRTKVYRSSLYVIKEKMNKEEISNDIL
ncbi:hypothetical protein BCR32DRAFT_325222, partial [Anaeromyces robustus]